LKKGQGENKSIFSLLKYQKKLSATLVKN